MNRKVPVGGRIPAAELPRVKRWALPRVESGHVVTSPFQQKPPSVTAPSTRDEDLDLGELTVAALQQLRDAARREGLEQGLAEGRAKGEQQGRKEGHDAGYKAAYQQAQGEIDDLKARLSGMIKQLSAPLAGQEQALEQAALTLVRDISRAVVGRELATRPELLEDAVRRALDRLPQQETLSFSVHPDDEVALQALREREGGDWEIRGDASMARGSLRVRGLNSYLDYGVAGRFADVLAQLERDAAEVPDDDGVAG